MERVKSELLSSEEKIAELESQQAKAFDELEQRFRQEMETLQEYLKSQEKEYVSEIERAKVYFWSNSLISPLWSLAGTEKKYFSS